MNYSGSKDTKMKFLGSPVLEKNIFYLYFGPFLAILGSNGPSKMVITPR